MCETVASKRRSVRHATWRLVPGLLAVLLLCAGCGARRTAAGRESGDVCGDEGAHALTAETARAALIEMVESSCGKDEPIAYALPQLKTKKAEKAEKDEGGNGNVIRFGSWIVDLEHRTFVLFIFSGLMFLDYCGEFRPTESGGWEAEVTEIRETYVD